LEKFYILFQGNKSDEKIVRPEVKLWNICVTQLYRVAALGRERNIVRGNWWN